MNEFAISRRSMLAGSLMTGVAVSANAVQRHRHVPDQFDLVTRPVRVFKTPDRSHENTESWIFYLVVQTTTQLKLKPEAMQVDFLRGSTLLRSTLYIGEGLRALTYPNPPKPSLADGSMPLDPIYWPFDIRLRGTEPISLGVDALRAKVEAVDEAGRLYKAEALIPIATYTQKTRLIFPFKGKGIILQGGASNGGHRNRSGQFALDACGLDDAWSVEAPGDGKHNQDYPGFGRPLIAPADGVVVRARSDRPDQPVGDVSDPKYYATEYADGGDPGNHLIIDHENGEFSMMAHFLTGSMSVKKGDRVRQGESLGRLGHSGDTTAPHLDYQLQAGPDWEFADGLPVKFSNVSEPYLDRGTYFEAK